MKFEEWWMTMLPAEVDALESVFRQAWRLGAEEERDACAKIAMMEAAMQHERDSAINPHAFMMHSPDSAKWRKMAALILMRDHTRVTHKRINQKQVI